MASSRRSPNARNAGSTTRLAGVESVADRRPGVEQQGVPLGPHQHCQALPDIEHLQIGLTGFGQGTVRPQQRQPQQQRH